MVFIQQRISEQGKVIKNTKIKGTELKTTKGRGILKVDTENL